jgi:hypothetical protein
MKQTMTQEEAVTAYFVILFQNMPGASDKSMKNLC